MNGGGTATFRSILDKPLNQLTEDDISQLTREDCRRFLKEKGMRRPSWNKSQAIQQVISLKALLQPSDDDDDSSPASQHHHPPRQTSPPRECAPSGSVGQMTIFYCGKVNVYDGVSPDKARAIMQLAASPVQFPQDDPLNRNAAVWASMDKDVNIPIDTTILQVAQAGSSWLEKLLNFTLTEFLHYPDVYGTPDKIVEYPPQYRERGSIARDDDVEGQANRKVSLQRYLEKRKDRGRVKGKKLTGITSSNLEMYLNLTVKAHASNGNSSHSSTSSPPQPRLPPADNQLKVALPIDLNDKDVQEC